MENNNLIDDVKVGDNVRGSWREQCTGMTYYQEGVIIEHPKTGLWVQTESDGGITPLSIFFFLKKVDVPMPEDQKNTCDTCGSTTYDRGIFSICPECDAPEWHLQHKTES